MSKQARTLTGLVMTTALVAVAGCVSHQRVKPLPNAGRYTIHVLAETGADAALSDRQIRQREQVRAWMERDLVNLLRKRGRYQARAIAARDQFTPGPNAYLLHVRIDRYHAGSKFARAAVGYGAGAASLDTVYDLYGEGDTPILTGKQGVGSSRDWYQCVRKVNELTLDDITRKLRDIR